ncbi:MAG: WD40 repeat domain-containing protein [Candidatus Poseidoniaceae archaeon]|nr:WD40 repeat domain-containing protein [Candidatus Poseidoniaceae archaeon]
MLRSRIIDFQFSSIAMLLLIILVPATTATSSGLSYTGGLSNPLEVSNSQAVDINYDNTLLATGYNGVLTIHSIEDNSLLASFELIRQIVDLKFSPDGATLALSLIGSEVRTDNIQLIDIESLQLITDVNSNSNSETKSISWSPDSTILAVPNSDNGVDLLRKSDLSIEGSLSSGHNTDVSCIAFSTDGNTVLTGDESGRVLTWDRQGNPTGKQWELNSEVVGCDFDSGDLRIGLLGENGRLKTVDPNGGGIHQSDFISGSEMLWSGDGSYIHIIESSTQSKIITIETSTFTIKEETILFHRASDFAVIENSNFLPEKIFVTSDTQNIAIYGSPELPIGYGENGADLDGDGIPDHLDNDDDGDSISDEWDINCDSSAEECSNVPNQDDIRNLNIWINQTTLEIEDVITLSSQQSSIIRNMSRKSVIADQQLSHSEAVRFSNSVCDNMDTADFIDSWKAAIELSVGQVENGIVSCNTRSGMTLTEIDDERTRIKIVLKVSFTLFPDARYPLQLSLMYQPEATDGSIANLAEAHPIHVMLDGEQGLPASWSPWWVEENKINLQLEEDIPPSPTMLETFVKITIEYPWIAVFVILMLTVSALTYIRTRNASNVDLEFAFDDFEDIPKKTKEDVFVNELDEEESLTHDEVMRKRQINRKIGRKKSQPSEAVQQIEPESTIGGFYDDEDDVTPVVVRRRAGSVKRSRDGAVVTGKRTTLRSVGEHAAPVTAKKVATKKAVVKTRRVVTGQTDNQVMDDALDRLTKDD